jgi:hypothetical protein
MDEQPVELTPEQIEDLPKCSYDPETGELFLESGGVFTFGFLPMNDELYQTALNFMQKCCDNAHCSIFVTCKGRDTIFVSCDPEFADRINMGLATMEKDDDPPDTA